MPLSKVINEVLQDALTNALKVLDAAENEAFEVVDRVEREVLQELAQMEETGKASRQAAVQRILSTAEIQSKNMAIAAVEEEVNKIFDSVLEKIAKESGTPEFKKMLSNLLDETVQVMGRDIVVETNEAALPLLREVVAEKKYGVKVVVSDKPAQIVAGLRATSLDGSMRYDNSVEARLERLKPVLRTEIAKMLMQKE
ncbi:MAG: V-type ATP synthase subunit E [Candidatus Caldarchaeum sp.]